MIQMSTIQKILAGVGALILLGVSFYGGRAYQNSIDQKLFNDYNPPTAGGTRTGLGAGGGAGLAAGGAGQGSLTRAALSVGSPPGTNSAPGAGSLSSSGSGLSAAGQSNRVVGSLASISRTSLSLQSFQGGTQSVALTSQTRFYKTLTAGISALSPGEQVTVQASGSTQKPVAISITVGPARLAAAGGRRGGSGGGFGGVPVRTLSGTLTSVAANAIGVSGVSAPVALTSSTRINRLAVIQPSQLKTGSFVTVQVGTVGGQQAAIAVLVRNNAFRGSFSGSGGSSG